MNIYNHYVIIQGSRNIEDSNCSNYDSRLIIGTHEGSEVRIVEVQ